MFNIIGYFMIPFFTMLLPGNSNWLNTNFSVIGSRFPGQFYLIIWGILTSTYFYILIGRLNRLLFKQTQISKKSYEQPAKKLRKLRRPQKPDVAIALAKLSAILLLISVFIPYLPEHVPHLSALHVICAFLASVGLFFCFIILTYFMTKHSKKYWVYLGFLGILPPVCIVLFFASGYIISSAMEIFFTIFCSIYGLLLYHSIPISSFHCL